MGPLGMDPWFFVGQPTRPVCSYSFGISIAASIPEILVFTDWPTHIPVANIGTSDSAAPGAPWIASPLYRLFKVSLDSGSLPEDWTRATITPVFKKGNKHCPKNCRPVSFTCLIVKVLECLIHRKMERFLADNDKISSSQHGFRRAHSCQTQLLETIHQWAETLDRGTSSHAIFWILRKLSTRFHKRGCFWSWTTLESEVNCSEGLELFCLIGSSECCVMDAHQLGPEWFEFHKGLYSDHYCFWSILMTSATILITLQALCRRRCYLSWNIWECRLCCCTGGSCKVV